MVRERKCRVGGWGGRNRPDPRAAVCACLGLTRPSLSRPRLCRALMLPDTLGSKWHRQKGLENTTQPSLQNSHGPGAKVITEQLCFTQYFPNQSGHKIHLTNQSYRDPDKGVLYRNTLWGRPPFCFSYVVHRHSPRVWQWGWRAGWRMGGSRWWGWKGWRVDGWVDPKRDEG